MQYCLWKLSSVICHLRLCAGGRTATMSSFYEREELGMLCGEDAIRIIKSRPMNISDQIGSSHVEEMKKILEFILSFHVSKQLYAISAKRMDEETIRNITLGIRQQNLRLNRQTLYLFCFGRTLYLYNRNLNYLISEC